MLDAMVRGTIMSHQSHPCCVALPSLGQGLLVQDGPQQPELSSCLCGRSQRKVAPGSVPHPSFLSFPHSEPGVKVSLSPEAGTVFWYFLPLMRQGG